MRILTAEDDPIMSKLLVTVLERWGYEVTAVQDGLQACRMLLEPSAPKLALLDWMLPGMNGVEICRTLRAQNPASYTYIILLTGRTETKDLISGLEAGADEYLKKPFDLEELKMRLRTGRRILELEERLLRAQEVLRLEATTDALTGAWSRREITRLLESELARSIRAGDPMTLAIIDLDYFKDINDRLGHLVGDAVLKELVWLIRTSLRPYDQIGRFGGDEFVLLLPHCDAEAANGIGERIRRLVETSALETPDGSVRMTVSIGLASAPPHSAGPRELLAAADEALYRSKEKGRNSVTSADRADGAEPGVGMAAAGTQRGGGFLQVV